MVFAKLGMGKVMGASEGKDPMMGRCTLTRKVLARCEENNMRSHRPIRDWEQDRDKDVFYSMMESSDSSDRN